MGAVVDDAVAERADSISASCLSVIWGALLVPASCDQFSSIVSEWWYTKAGQVPGGGFLDKGPAGLHYGLGTLRGPGAPRKLEDEEHTATQYCMPGEVLLLSDTVAVPHDSW